MMWGSRDVMCLTNSCRLTSLPAVVEHKVKAHDKYCTFCFHFCFHCVTLQYLFSLWLSSHLYFITASLFFSKPLLPHPAPISFLFCTITASLLFCSVGPDISSKHRSGASCCCLISAASSVLTTTRRDRDGLGGARMRELGLWVNIKEKGQWSETFFFF